MRYGIKYNVRDPNGSGIYRHVKWVSNMVYRDKIYLDLLASPAKIVGLVVFINKES